MILWADTIRPYPEHVVRAAINQHRAERSFDDPDLKAVREKLSAWREEHPVVDPTRRLGSDKGRTAVERIERYMVGGKSAWIADGMPEQHWSKMEEAIRGYEATGQASHWTVPASIVGVDWGEVKRPKAVQRWIRLKELARKARIAEGRA